MDYNWFGVNMLYRGKHSRVYVYLITFEIEIIRWKLELKSTWCQAGICD